MENRTLDQSTIQSFTDTIRGEPITPTDPEYDTARSIYNGMIDKHPALIVPCENVADVISAVQFARDQQLEIAIRGGGHNVAGLAIVEEGLVIDLTSMDGIRVNPDERTVRVEGGATWGQVDHATHAFGLAVPNGVISTTGVAGLTLGGGHGYLSRKYGLTIDNLLEVDVVLADGRLVTANESNHSDLFWGIRGGGGNFGVVTSFKFRSHPVKTVIGGPTLWPMEQAETVLKWYRDFLPNAPRDLYGFLALMMVPPAPTFPKTLHHEIVCGIVWCYTGPEEQSDEAFAPVLEIGEPVLHGVQPMPYPELQSAFDALLPQGQQNYWKGDFVNELPDEAVALHIQYGTELPTPLSTMHLYPIDGAVQDVGSEDTAWAYRDTTWSMYIGAIHPDTSQNDEMIKWAQSYWKALHPYTAGGGYANFLMEEGQDRIHAAYQDNYDRLATIKAQYDPENVFHVNQNITPSDK